MHYHVFSCISHLSYPELNNCRVKEDTIIISRHVLCRIFIQ